MNNKEDLKKQVIILSLVLVFVIIVAVFLNTRNSNKPKNLVIPDVKSEIINTTNTTKTKELTQEEKMKANLKGLLEEPDSDIYLEQELNEKNETVVTTKSGETIIIKD